MHNGWNNYETWNIQGLVDNCDGIHQAHRLLIESNEPLTPAAVSRFVQQHVVNLPNFRTETLEAVDFQELADHWQGRRNDFLEKNTDDGSA